MSEAHPNLFFILHDFVNSTSVHKCEEEVVSLYLPVLYCCIKTGCKQGLKKRKFAFCGNL